MPKIKESEIPETQTEILGIKASANPSFPIVMFCKFKKIVADRIPVTPPKNESIIPSATINHAIDNLVYPKVLRTANSETLPRTAINIVFAINPTTANTAAIPIQRENFINSINSFAVLAKNAFPRMYLSAQILNEIFDQSHWPQNQAKKNH